MGNLGLAPRQLSPSASAYLREAPRAIHRYAVAHKAVLALFAIALASRLPLLSISLDEVDAANFHNALAYGYNILQVRPHPPGYPVYIFMGWLINSILDDPLLSLTLLSAVLGSLSVVPFYLLLKEFTNPRLAIVGSLLFLANPLLWSVSEAALSDVPSMFLALMVALMVYRARHSDLAFLLASVLLSLAIGVRQPNVALLLLFVFPLGYRVLVRKEWPWSLTAAGAVLFMLTSIAWFLPTVLIGAENLSLYLSMSYWQYASTVEVFDVTHVEAPWLPNAIARVLRFFFGYFLTYAWTGGDSRTPETLLAIIPWLFGLALFFAGFRWRNGKHVFLALWMVSLAYTVLVIHFLPRYGLPQLPAAIMASLVGYQFLSSRVLRHSHRAEVLAVLAIGCVAVLFGIKYQPPVATFEHTPPSGSLYGNVILVVGLALVAYAGRMYWRHAGETLTGLTRGPGWYQSALRSPHVVLVALALLVVPYTVNGYLIASIAHREASPNYQLTQYVKRHYDTSQVVPCWDRETHSFFAAVTPQAVPLGFWSVDALYNAYNSGKTLLASNKCPRFYELKRVIGLTKIAEFSGTSPLWAKTPEISLYSSVKP